MSLRSRLAQFVSKLKTNRRFALLFGAATFAGLIVVTVVGFEATTTPAFCGSCHYIKEYYDQWKVSSHKEVKCVECHVNPGAMAMLKRKFEAMHEGVSIITGKAPNRPHAEVSDASCMRPSCHSKEQVIAAGDLTMDDGIAFNHASHLSDSVMPFRCTSCHAQTDPEKHIGINKQACVLCHFKKAESHPAMASLNTCGTCNKKLPEEVTLDGTDETFDHTSFAESQARCADCHNEIVHHDGGDVLNVLCQRCHNEPAILAQVDDGAKMHEIHVKETKVECYLCHEMIPHEATAAQEAAGTSECASCHERSHEAAMLLYQGKGGIGVEGSPSAKAGRQVDCNACHDAHMQTASTQKAAGGIQGIGQACVRCHGEGAEEYLSDWKSTVNESLTEALQTLAKAEKQKSDSAEYAKALKDARHNIELVRDGKGVHNVEYAVELLSASQEMLEPYVK